MRCTNDAGSLTAVSLYAQMTDAIRTGVARHISIFVIYLLIYIDNIVEQRVFASL